MMAYVIMTLAVVLLAGLTGSMPPLQGPRQAGPRNDDVGNGYPAWGPSPKTEDVEKTLPSEILDALAEAERLNVAEQVVDRELLIEIVDNLVHGAQFVAVTSEPGAEKTVIAAEIREELTGRSVSVRSVDGRGGSGITLRAIMSQVLDKPEADIGSEDIEQLFDAMTERDAADERLVLIIDDAELLLSNAIAYLRLLASVAMQRMPQIVFIGDASFWDVAARTAGFTELITARFELVPLDRDQTCITTEEPVSVTTRVCGSAPDQDGLDHAPQRSGGLLRRLVSFVVATRGAKTNTHQNEATIANVKSAIGALSCDALAVRCEHHPAPAIATPEALKPALSNPLGGMSITRMACLAVMVVGLVGVPTHRLTVPLVGRLTAEPQETALKQPLSADSASTIVVRLPATAIATPDTSDPDSLIAPIATGAAVAHDFVEPPLLPNPEVSSATVPRKHVARARTVGIQRPSTGYAPGATGGTWLFQANLTGGSNS
jgi:hypothetical protein